MISKLYYLNYILGVTSLKVTIIATGNELTEGIILDKNSKYLAERLKELGHETLKIINVKDDITLIENSLKDALNISDIIITTGGLGPTKDDLTVQAVSEILGIEILFNESLYERIRKYYKNKTNKYLDILKKQAYVLKTAEIFLNPVGSAPGQKVIVNGKMIYLLPGPFAETKAIFDAYIYDELSKYLDAKKYEFKLYFYGLTEAEFMNEVSSFLDNVDYSTKIEEYIGPSLRIRLENKKNFDTILKDILDKFSDYFIGYERLEKTLLTELISKNLKISFAESCTGGMISDIFVSTPGSSKAFEGSVVAYSNKIKIKLLNVSENTLNEYGAVSSQTVTEMVKGLKNLTDCDVGVAVSGIAGPTGGTKEKPVGTVYFSFYFKNKIHIEKMLFQGNREDIRKRASYFALWKVLCIIRRVE